MRPIDTAAVRESLDPDVTARLDRLDVFAEIDSTNSYLMRQPAPATGKLHVAIAGHQTAGRGRSGREWVSAPGASLCLSAAYTFSRIPENLPALTLAVGVAVVGALGESGVEGVSLKWPNDVVARDGKLGGMLAEAHHRGGQRATVVAGIGLNIDLPASLLRDNASRWAQRAVDLKGLSGASPSREGLSAALVNHIAGSLVIYEASGFDAFADAWRSHDWLLGRRITVEERDGDRSGTAAGVDEDGALLLQHRGRTRRIRSGSITIAST